MKKNGKSTGPATEPSDLQQIRGIGQSIARSLNSIGIQTVADLAQYTTEGLIELLKDRVPNLTLQRIEREDWTGQARALVQAGHWQEVADFFVSFGYSPGTDGEQRLRTRAHHSQADQGMEWDGLALAELSRWMAAQSRLEDAGAINTPSSFRAEEVRKEPEFPAQDIELELVDVWVTNETAQPQTGQAVVIQMLRATCRLLLHGPDAIDQTYEENPYSVEVYLVDTSTNQSHLAAMCQGQLHTGQMAYPIEQNFDIPPVGSYQIYILARLQTPGAPATHVQGPLLQVEP